MESNAGPIAAWVLGLCLVVVAIAGVVPPAVAATLGVAGVALMGVYAVRAVRGGYLHGDRGASGHIGDHRSDGGGWFGGDGGGGGGGDGGGGGGGS